MKTRLTDDLKAWIGREATYTAPEELGRASLRYFALALADDNPIYSDPEFAKGTVHGDVIAPPTFVCETNQIDGLLAKAGTSKAKLLSANIWLRDIAHFAEMNDVWDKWVDPDNLPVRATVEARLATPELLVEIQVTALA